MRENRFFTIALALSSAVLLMLSFARIAQETEPPRYKVSVVVDESGSGRWFPFREGLMQAARDNNIQLNFVTTDALVSVQQEGRIIGREIQNGARGIIAGFRSSEGTAEMLKGFTGQAVIELVDTDVETEDGGYSIGLVKTDNLAIGEALGEQLAADISKDYQSGGRKKRLGILSGNQQQLSVQERLSSFSGGIDEENVDKLWVINENDATRELLIEKIREIPVDIIVALDNRSMELAMSCIKAESNILLYGVGCSEALVYGLDSGVVEFMIVPEEFSMGYHALSDLAARLNHRTSSPVKREIGFRSVNRENMYEEENQRVLFPRIE